MARPFNILVVENDPVKRDVMREALHTHGFVASTAADPYEALCVLMEQHVDLLLTDGVMPGGLELEQQAKLLRPNLKVLHATGDPQQAAVENDPGGAQAPRLTDLIEQIHATMAAAG